MATITQQPNGSWRYRVHYTKNGKKREVSKSGFRLKSQAEAAAAVVAKSLRQGVDVSGGRQTVGQYMDYFLEIRKEQVKPATYTRLDYQNRLHILPTFEFTPLNEVTRHDCNEWIAKLSRKMAGSTARSVIGTFRSALTYAVQEDRILDYNPLDHIQLPKITHDEKQIKFFTRSQLTTLMEYMRTHSLKSYSVSKQYYALFGILAHTGLRLGEALALTWADINGNELTVNKQLHYDYHNNATIGTPKTDSSYRTIQLDQFTMNLLRIQKKNRLEVVARYKTYLQPSEERFKNLIFYGQNGLPLRHSSVRTQMKIICKEAGVPQLSPHAFRHTHAVLLLEAGVNMKAVSTRLGHATINMTADVYMHVTKTMEDDLVARLNNYL